MIHHCHKGVVALHPAPPLVPTLALVWQSNRPKQFINGRKLTWHKKSSVTLATQISFTQGQINVRLGEDGGTCQGGTWVGVFSLLDRRELLHQLKLSCIPGGARLSHFALEETSASLHQPLHAECSSYVQHHFNVLPSISTGKWTLGTTCTEVVNNSPHGTHPTRRAQAKHFPHTGQRNFAFCKLLEQIPFKPAILQWLPRFHTELYDCKATNAILIGIKCSSKKEKKGKRKQRVSLFHFSISSMRASLPDVAKNQN